MRVKLPFAIAAVGVAGGLAFSACGGGTPRYADTYPGDFRSAISVGLPTATGSQVDCVAQWIEGHMTYGAYRALTAATAAADDQPISQACNITVATLEEPSS